MKNLLILLIIFAFSSNAKDISNEELARDIFFGVEILNIDEHSKSMAQMIITRQPQWEAHKTLISERAFKILSSESYQHNISKIISKNFSRAELLQLKKIMKEPVMLKWYKEMPNFWPEITMTTTDHVLPEINNLITELQIKDNYLSTKVNDSNQKTFEEFFKVGDCSSVHSKADEFLRTNSKDIHALYAKGYCLQIEKSYDQALEYFVKVFEINPKFRHINLNLANIYLMQREEEEAIKYATKDVDLYPQSSDSFYMLAKVHGYIGNKEPSLKAFHKSLQLNPKNLMSLYEQAFLLLNNGEKVESCKLFERAAAIEPKMNSMPLKKEACGT